MKNSYKFYLQNTTKYLVALLFIYTAFSKILDYSDFIFQLEKSPLIPVGKGDIFGLGVIVSEILASYLLFKKEQYGLYLSLFLMASFTVYLYVIINYSYYIPCSCGGVLEQMDWNTHIIFNLGITVLIISSILSQVTSNPKSNNKMQYA